MQSADGVGYDLPTVLRRRSLNALYNFPDRTCCDQDINQTNACSIEEPKPDALTLELTMHAWYNSLFKNNYFFKRIE